MTAAETAELSIAEQLERGPGSDDLDAGLYCWLKGYREWSMHGHHNDRGGWLTYSYLTGTGKRITSRSAPPRYSRSVDDALALVPGGWIVAELRQWIRTPSNEPYWTCGLSQHAMPCDFVRVEACGDNPLPRAICLAALQAKELR